MGYLGKDSDDPRLRAGYANASPVSVSPRCQAANKTCPANHTWNSHICRCLAQQDFMFASAAGDGKSVVAFN